jgi:hypothetical protein
VVLVESLVFSLVPEEGKRVRLDTLEAAIVEMRRLVTSVDRAVFRAEGVRRSRRWYVERLSSSSPTIAIAADESTSPLERKTDAVFVDGLRELASGSLDSPPPFFSESELNDLVDLKHRVIDKGLRYVSVSTDTSQDSTRQTPVHISSNIEPNVERILRKSIEALGALDGELDAINTRAMPYFTLWEHLSGQPVLCTFDLEQLVEVKALLHRAARVSGVVRYFANGRPRSIARVEMLRAIESNGPRSRKDFWATIPSLAHGADSIELPRRAEAE